MYICHILRAKIFSYTHCLFLKPGEILPELFVARVEVVALCAGDKSLSDGAFFDRAARTEVSDIVRPAAEAVEILKPEVFILTHIPFLHHFGL